MSDRQAGADRRALLRWAAARIPGPTPRLDAELLLAHVLGESRSDLLLGDTLVPFEAEAAFRALVRRRMGHEPVAYLVGAREFWSLPLAVSPAVLIPRPDSETLVEAAQLMLAGRPPRLVLDLGTGSGALLLAALSLWPDAFGVGVDRCRAALAVAQQNARRLGFESRAAFLLGDWASGIGGRFDLVLANPPYVPDAAALDPDVARHEPPGALFAGPDGLDAFRRLVPTLPGLLAPGAIAILELDPRQETEVAGLAARAGLSARAFPDLSGRTRALALHVPSETERFPLGKAPATH
ncbi:MAG: peptide chain release factor N(5)-glutamine methyltransferase [Sphingomonadaceae bacterium]